MTHTYALVNPLLIGTLNTTVQAQNSANAAKEIYNRISPYFSATQPNLIFTLQKLKSTGGNIGQRGGGNDKSSLFFPRKRS